MEEIYSTKQIIEMLKKSPKVEKGEIDIKKIKELAQRVNNTMKLRKAISQIEAPIEQKRYIEKMEQQDKLTEDEKDALQSAHITIQIKLGEYREANEALIKRIVERQSDEINYYDIDKLVFTERMLGHIGLAKDLALVALEKNPNHVTPRNELMHIAIMEGNKEEARKLIAEQKAFYEKKKSLKTMEFVNYEEDEKETLKLEEILEGKTSKEISK